LPPLHGDTIIIEADQRHGDEPPVAIAIEVDTGAAIAEDRLVTEPICAAVSDPEAKLFEETERLLYLPGPPVRPWHLELRHFPIQAA
jgi:hypothetical protein